MHFIVNEESSAHWRKSTPSMFLNWIVKMSTQVAVLCVIEPLIVTGRLLLLFQRYLVHKFPGDICENQEAFSRETRL